MWKSDLVYQKHELAGWEVIFVMRELQSLEISQHHLVILDLLLKLAEEA